MIDISLARASPHRRKQPPIRVNFKMNISAINIIVSLTFALVFHELGHLLAARVCRVPVTQAGFGWGPKVFGFRFKEVDYQLRALPVGAYVRMDMLTLQRRPLLQQLFVLLAGVTVNFVLSGIAWGTFFGTINLLLAVGNLFPLYQQDGWKSGMVFFRRVFNRPSPLVEWSFTLSAGFVALIAVAHPLINC
jgi:membrane-associated protease RseP (regulator of RpoE activity)